MISILLIHAIIMTGNINPITSNKITRTILIIFLIFLKSDIIHNMIGIKIIDAKILL